MLKTFTSMYPYALRRSLLILIFLTMGGALFGLPDLRVAILRDGASTYFDRLNTQFKSELEGLSEGKRRIIFEDRFDAGYDPVRVREHLEEALSDEGIDLIFAGGLLATKFSQTRNGLEKPVIGGALQFSPVDSDFLSSSGTSTIPNYTFIASHQRVSNDLNQLETLTGARKIYILVDEVYREVVRERVDVDGLVGIEGTNRTYPILFVGADAVAILRAIPADAEAVYVTVLPRMNEAGMQALYNGLANRKLPSMAMAGRSGVEQGALFGLAPNTLNAVARRAALNVHFLASGETTEQLPVYLPVQDQLVINAETAQAISWSPDYDTSLAADFIGREFRMEGEGMRLYQALDMASELNADAEIAREEAVISQSDMKLARSNLLPQVNLVGSDGYTRMYDRITPSTTPQSNNQLSLGLQLRQVLFNDALRTSFKTSKLQSEALKLQAQSVELDAVAAVAKAYFNCLRSELFYKIERDNLRLTENHYQMAKLRVEIGSADEAEIYRWEQSRAQGRAAIIQAEAARLNAVVEFNRLLGFSGGKQWDFESIEMSERDLYFMDSYLLPLLGNADQFMRFGDYLKQCAVEHSPELKAFDEQILAQGMVLKQKKRRSYLPEVALSASLSHSNRDNDFINRDSEHQAYAELTFTLPIYEGYRKREEIIKAQRTLRLLNAQREKAIQQVEAAAMNAFHTILSAHPNIRLSRASLEAAQLNFDSVSEKYAEGAASILDLIDAQQSLLARRQGATGAVYDYLTAIFQVQRSIAWFEFQQNEAARSEWAEGFGTFLRTNSQK